MKIVRKKTKIFSRHSCGHFGFSLASRKLVPCLLHLFQDHHPQWPPAASSPSLTPPSMTFPIRSPYDTVSGIVLVSRLIDKARLQAANQLPAGYHVGPMPGNRTFDDRFCRFIDLPYETFVESVLQGGTDEEILERCLSFGRRPDAEQIEIWNGFMTKRGWRDSGTASLIRSKEEAGLAHREELVTFFDLMDVEEGRKP